LEVVTTFAIIVGLVAANFFQPGEGIDVSNLAKGDKVCFFRKNGLLYF